jgi:folate-binding protein YgfZ
MSITSPLAKQVGDAGAVFEEDAGWLMAAHFGDPNAEYRLACADAVVFDVSNWGKVEVSGADAASFLHNLSTNDVLRLPPGSGCEAFLPTGQARIVAHGLIYRLRSPEGRESFWLDLAPGHAENVLKHLDHYLIAEQVELADWTREFAQLHLAGAQAHAVLGRALGAPPPALGHLQHTLALFGGSVPCQVRRHDPLGLPGYDLVCPAGGGPTVWQRLREAGATPAGLQGYHVLRVEAGTPLYGIDIDETNLPQEVGRTDQAVSLTKGCYIGQETIARIRTYGHVNRSLVGLRLAAEGAAPRGARVLRHGKEVGAVTSSAVSPRLGAPVALAYVRRGNEEPGTVLEVESGGLRWRAEVASLPFTGTGTGGAG